MATIGVNGHADGVRVFAEMQNSPGLADIGKPTDYIVLKVIADGGLFDFVAFPRAELAQLAEDLENAAGVVREHIKLHGDGEIGDQTTWKELPIPNDGSEPPQGETE